MVVFSYDLFSVDCGEGACTNLGGVFPTDGKTVEPRPPLWDPHPGSGQAAGGGALLVAQRQGKQHSCVGEAR